MADQSSTKNLKKTTDTAPAPVTTAHADAPEANPQFIEIWPLRSYQDAGEIKRRGGPSYSVPKRHADALIARGLATDDQPAKAETDSNQ